MAMGSRNTKASPHFRFFSRKRSGTWPREAGRVLAGLDVDVDWKENLASVNGLA